jgi:hypothetical protein
MNTLAKHFANVVFFVYKFLIACTNLNLGQTSFDWFYISNVSCYKTKGIDV